MRPSRTAGHRSDRRDTSVTIATHVYELPVVREEPIRPPDAPPDWGLREPRRRDPATRRREA